MMTSLRTGFGLPVRPSDRYCPRKSEGNMSRGADPRSMRRTGSKNMKTPPRPGNSTSPPSHVVNKTPQIPASCSPSRPRSALRNPSTLQIDTLSESHESHSQARSVSSSMRSFDNTPKATQSLHKRVHPTVSRDHGSLHPALGTSSSSNLACRYPNTVDTSPGIPHDREATESPAQMPVEEAVEMRNVLAQPADIYPELDRYRDFQPPDQLADRREIDYPYPLTTHDLPSPTPLSLWFSGSSQTSAASGSPSTKFSESPGPEAHSRDTTPTSLSSQSPVFVAPNRVGAPYRATRKHSASSTRPPLTRRRAGSFFTETDTEALDPTGLASVRESLTSSSSSSTMKEGNRIATRERTKENRLPPSPPSPPPRLSSQNFRQHTDNGEPSNMISLQHGRHQEVFSSPQSPRSKDTPSLSHTSSLARPRRYNTFSMNSKLPPASPTIIQSNLTSTVRGGKEYGDVSVAATSSPRLATSFLQMGKSPSTSNLASTGRARALTSPKSLSSVELRLNSSKEPAFLPQSSQANTRTTSRTRFPFFGRKKSSSEGAAKTDRKTEQKNYARKGPVAGTGHEGYGRVGATRRRSGSSSALPHTMAYPQSSFDSSTSSDSFLADRVNPVVISGGEVVENRNTSPNISRSELCHALSSRPSTDSKSSLQHSSNIRMAPSNSTSEEIAMQSTLAFRRSMQRLRSIPDIALRLPQPINTSRNVTSPTPLTSFDTGILSDESSHVVLQQSACEERSASHPALKKAHTIPLSPRKWNIFSRSHKQISTKKGKIKEQIAATVRSVEKRPIAYYAILDTTNKNDRQDVLHADVQQVLRKADVYPQSFNAGAAPDNSFAIQKTSSPQNCDELRQKSLHLPIENTSTTTISSSSSVVGYSHSMSSGRPSRLAQVGRIPPVVRRRQKSPSPQSFSRPFRASLHVPNKNTITFRDTQSIPASLFSPRLRKINAVPELLVKDSTLQRVNNTLSNATLSSSLASPTVGLGGKEFLAFSSRMNSASTMYASSSSGTGNPFATTTAVVPNPEDPPVEDEVWDEYNDLLGDDSMKESKTAAFLKEATSQLKSNKNKLINQKALNSSMSFNDRCKNSTCHKATKDPKNRYSVDVIRCIQTAFLHPNSNPTARQLPSSTTVEHAGSRSSVRAACEPISKSSSSSLCQTFFSDYSACSSKGGTHLAQVNLRVGSMTVSKWLTFGHVLFSEIRHELTSVKTLAQGHSILVIDGLGNDDWSFYAAETYTSTSFFNLSPRASLPSAVKNDPTRFPLSPSNHHQIQYTSHLDNFPFASQSFDGLVYRFPTVAPESHYRNILSEARRVLRPNGYIELSILDFDLNNMGNRGRRTVRHLKEKIRLQHPDMSFTSTADIILRLLGNLGFTNIKVARVGVPIANSLAHSGTRGEKNKSESGKKKDSPILPEMMSNKSPSMDENISKVVTRVGRWWYNRCYENAAGLRQEKSIWDDRSFLSECERYRTSLKLMVCCARVPDRMPSL